MRSVDERYSEDARQAMLSAQREAVALKQPDIGTAGEQGCPSCVQSPRWGNLDAPLAKADALEMLARMLER